MFHAGAGDIFANHDESGDERREADRSETASVCRGRCDDEVRQPTETMLRNNHYVPVQLMDSAQDHSADCSYHFIVQEVPFSNSLDWDELSKSGAEKCDVYWFQQSYKQHVLYRGGSSAYHDSIAVEGCRGYPRNLRIFVVCELMRPGTNRLTLCESFFRQCWNKQDQRMEIGGVDSLILYTVRRFPRYEDYLPDDLVRDKYLALKIIASVRYYEVARIFHHLPEHWKKDRDVAFFAYLRRGKCNVQLLRNELNKPPEDSILLQHPFFEFERLFDQFQTLEKELKLCYRLQEKGKNCARSRYLAARVFPRWCSDMIEKMDCESDERRLLAKLVLMGGRCYNDERKRASDFGYHYWMEYGRRLPNANWEAELPDRSVMSGRSIERLPDSMQHDEEFLQLSAACGIRPFSVKCRDTKSGVNICCNKETVLKTIRVHGGGRRIFYLLHASLRNDIDVICGALHGGDVNDDWDDDVLDEVDKSTFEDKAKVTHAACSLHIYIHSLMLRFFVSKSCFEPSCKYPNCFDPDSAEKNVCQINQTRLCEWWRFRALH